MSENGGWKKRLAAAFSMLAIAAITLGSWAFFFEPAGLRITVHKLALPGWPGECGGMRVAVLGDLHVGAPYQSLAKLGRIVAATNDAKPDLVLLPGDFMITQVAGGMVVEPEPIAQALAGLTARGGVFAVLGNHDWWYDGPRVQQSFESAGIPDMENTARELNVGACRFWLAGIGDYLERKHDVTRALAAVPPGVALLAFTHNPDVFPEVPRRVTLTIAAHTHGGQVHLPFIGHPIVPSEYGERFVSDHIVEDGRHLFVHTGIGTSILPVRFRVPPEIAIVEMVSAPAEH